MINWINGKTDRFKALVCHDGNLDERMAYFDTEELWFPEWEHGGMPWEKPEGYAKHNPIELREELEDADARRSTAGSTSASSTPQGMATFTALQRKGVPSRFLVLPRREPLGARSRRTRKLWHDEVLAWIDRYTKKH